MREIKFKFLMEDGEATEPYYLKELIDSNTYINIESEYSSKIKQELQYTGLKDKNDVEIYEGDIVIVTEEDEDSCLGREFSYKGVVSYANSLKLSQYVAQYPTGFCLISKSFYKEQALLFNERWEHEVIGNIYENKELLA